MVTQLAIPSSPSLAGAQLFHQVVVLEPGAIASANGLALTIGVL